MLTVKKCTKTCETLKESPHLPGRVLSESTELFQCASIEILRRDRQDCTVPPGEPMPQETWVNLRNADGSLVTQLEVGQRFIPGSNDTTRILCIRPIYVMNDLGKTIEVIE